jgi:hypothetical protein
MRVITADKNAGGLNAEWWTAAPLTCRGRQAPPSPRGSSSRCTWISVPGTLSKLMRLMHYKPSLGEMLFLNDLSSAHIMLFCGGGMAAAAAAAAAAAECIGKGWQGAEWEGMGSLFGYGKLCRGVVTSGAREERRRGD